MATQIPAEPMRLTISGPLDDRVDAPTVDDFLGQVRDFVELLRGVEKAVEADGKSKLVWRVTDAQMNSPISMELTPYGSGPAAFVAARAALVEETAMEGLRALHRGEASPPYFTEGVMGHARQMHARVLKGLTTTKITMGGGVDPFLINKPAARALSETMARSKAEGSTPYRELGSVEGYVTKPELDGFDRAVLRFRARLDGTEIKAFASGAAFRQIADMTLSDVWAGVRVRVHGLINYRSLGQIEQINAYSIEVLDTDDLPGLDDIIDPNFTGGMTTEDFLDEGRL